MKDLEKNNGHIENLIHSYLSGSIEQKDKDELFRWLTLDPENVSYFNQISDIWLSSSVFQDTENFDTDDAFIRVKAKIEQVNAEVAVTKTPKIQLTWLKVAAVLIPVIFLSSLVTKLIFTDKPTTYSETPFLFEVPYGSKSTLSLPDGSKVILNAGSKLTCKEGFGRIHRELKLIGEAYFDVAKNKELPFKVFAGNLCVRALGTEFNVKAYPEDKDIETILVHGSIQINKTENNTNNPLILKPKQRLVYNKASEYFQVAVAVEENSNKENTPLPESNSPKVIYEQSNVDPVIYTSWKDESWNIYRMSLLELAVELERKYDVKIQFESVPLQKIKFTGTLRDESLEQILAALRLIAPIEFEVSGKQVKLMENKNLMKVYKEYYRDSESN